MFHNLFEVLGEEVICFTFMCLFFFRAKFSVTVKCLKIFSGHAFDGKIYVNCT